MCFFWERSNESYPSRPWSTEASGAGTGTEVTRGRVRLTLTSRKGDPGAGSARLQGQARSVPARPAAPLAPGFAGRGGAAGDGKYPGPPPRCFGGPWVGIGGGLHPTSRVQGSG